MIYRAPLDAARAAPPTAVLVVDDTASERLAMRAMLSPLGHEVVEADSGRAALRAVLRQDFAVILMDVRMPAMDGYETAKLIRQRSRSALTPIIFLTAFGLDETQKAMRTPAALSTSSSRRSSPTCCRPRSRASSTCS